MHITITNYLATFNTRSPSASSGIKTTFAFFPYTVLLILFSALLDFFIHLFAHHSVVFALTIDMSRRMPILPTMFVISKPHGCWTTLATRLHVLLLMFSFLFYTVLFLFKVYTKINTIQYNAVLFNIYSTRV